MTSTVGSITGAGGSTGAGELLQLMLDGTPRTRAEIVKLTGLARSTVGARVDALLAAGLLSASGEAASTGGRPPARLAFNPDQMGLLTLHTQPHNFIPQGIHLIPQDIQAMQTIHFIPQGIQAIHPTQTIHFIPQGIQAIHPTQAIHHILA